MVQTNLPYNNQQASIPNYDNEDPFAVISGSGGGKSISFNVKDPYGNNQTLPIGTAFTGVLAENIKVVPMLKYGTTEPDTYTDGNPKKQIRSILSNVLISLPDQAGGQWQDVRVTNTEQDDDDEGKRALYFKSQMKQALDEAMKVAGVKNFGIGTRILVRLVDMKRPNDPTFNAQKIYEVQLSEIQPFVPTATIQATAELQGAFQGAAPAAPQVPQQAVIPQQVAAPTPPPLQSPVPAQFPSAEQQVAAQQAVPQVPQYVTPAQPAFPGQVVPAPQQGVAPAAPQVPPLPQQAAPAATAPQQAVPTVTPEMVQQVQMVIQQGVDHAAAVDGVANMIAPGNAAFRTALDQSVPF